jgi:hypothetical protein
MSSSAHPAPRLFTYPGVEAREILGSTLVGHYTAQHRSFGGLVVPTWRRVFRRNPDGTVNLNMPSITIDIEDVALE